MTHKDEVAIAYQLRALDVPTLNRVLEQLPNFVITLQFQRGCVPGSSFFDTLEDATRGWIGQLGNDGVWVKRDRGYVPKFPIFDSDTGRETKDVVVYLFRNAASVP